MNMIESVNHPTAELFYKQCMGETNGQMASIPNSPIISSIALVHGVYNKEDFAVFLRQIADWLDGGGN